MGKRGFSNVGVMVTIALSIVAFLILYGIYIYIYKGADSAISNVIMGRI